MNVIDFYKTDTNTHILESETFMIEFGKKEFGYYIDRQTILLCESTNYSISSIFKLIYRLITHQ